jgi:hypothetical protein
VRRTVLGLGGLGIVGLTACLATACSTTSGVTGPDGGDDAPAAASPFEAKALEIAATYQSWGRVDDELRWAPFLCRQPLPGRAYVSDSSDSTTHGQKLYSVFAKHREHYPAGPHADQAVVKQSWTIEAVTGPDAAYAPQSYHPAEGDEGRDHFYPYATKDGGTYRASEPAGLFVMFKVDPPTADTDQGWVYATVSPAGKVTSSGRVASCMGCHDVSATHERLYGVPTAPPP